MQRKNTMYQMAVQQISANLPAAKAKRRRRPQCDPAVADTYRYIWAMQDAIKAVDMQALAKPDAEYADGLATGYWLARHALHKGGNLVARLRAALDRKHKDTTDRLDRGLFIDFDRNAGFSAAIVDILTRIAPVEAWVEQGYNARLMGLDRPTQAAPEADGWRAGWDLADSLLEANLSEADVKPGLDPLPLPAWGELVGVAV